MSKKPVPSFTHDDLVAELLRRPEAADGMKVDTLCETLGKSQEWVRTRLRRLMAAGRLVRGVAYGEALDGRQFPYVVYKLK